MQDIAFTKDTLMKPSKECPEAEGMECKYKEQTAKNHYEKVKVVKFFLSPSLEKMSQRMCLSEYPLGTIKIYAQHTVFGRSGGVFRNHDFIYRYF